MLSVFRGRRPGGGRGAKPGLNDRMDAATWLSDRAFGKPVQSLEHSGQIDSELSLRDKAERLRRLSPEDRAALRALAEKMETAALAAAPETGAGA
jgi:hypothetical protein